ncbi:hypothetical protein [Thalassotalea euphylliae]|uniref:Transcription elongation factor n=1 Tax=Thalassotalea euphylliae TaxID=1655234 RepID=A0A3E0UIY7_9GAMM|nr:hypothetical protein [Thalassotalea euphylliae]REL36859.1 hypothetical protein DXX92_16930 [Thalassotalea euphylliae]
MNKKEILAKVISEVEQLFAQALTAAQQAHNAAIDDQSVAETQYDTLAIEAAYLAEGQSRRITQLKEQLHILSKQSSDAKQQITIGALFTLEYDNESTSGSSVSKHFYLLPCAAGTCITLTNKEFLDGQKVYVLTPESPLGKVLVGLSIDDDFSVAIGANVQSGFVSAVY